MGNYLAISYAYSRLKSFMDGDASFCSLLNNGLLKALEAGDDVALVTFRFWWWITLSYGAAIVFWDDFGGC